MTNTATTRRTPADIASDMAHDADRRIGPDGPLRDPLVHPHGRGALSVLREFDQDGQNLATVAQCRQRVRMALSFRNRTQGALAFHIFRVVEMGIGAARHKGMDVEGFNDQPPAHWSGNDIADWGLKVRDQALDWWNAQADRTLNYTVATYYGQRPLHDVLERMTWYAAQHTRQLVLMLESGGTSAGQRLSEDDLRGLPVPDDVWG